MGAGVLQQPAAEAVDGVAARRSLNVQEGVGECVMCVLLDFFGQVD
jgi:hypothetical protein